MLNVCRIFFHCKERERIILKKDDWDRKKATIAVWILLNLDTRKVVLKL